MPYRVLKTDGTLVAEIPDGIIDTETLDINLVGKNTTGYGTTLNTNFVKLLENFASPAPGPQNPLKGQIWFNTTANRLNVFDGNAWRSTGAPVVSSIQPTTLTSGDLWINPTDNQLWFYDGTDLQLAGPVYTSTQGISGFRVVTVYNINGIPKTLAFLWVGNARLGFFSAEDFTLQEEITGFAGTSVRAGFNAIDTGLFFDVRVKSAENLVTTDSTVVSPDEFFILTADSNLVSGQVIIDNDDEDGLAFGADGSTFTVGTQGAGYSFASSIKNLIPDRDFTILVNDGGLTVPALYIDSSDQRLGIFTASPETTLDVNGTLTIQGDLVVKGTTTTVSSTTITVDDKNLELGVVSSPTDITADGGGITLKGSTDKTITWDLANTNWTSSENWNLLSGKSYKINNSLALSSTTLGSSVVNSSLTSVGTLVQLQVDNININLNTISSTTGDLILDSAGVISASSKRITSVADPISDNDAANKDYVDTALATFDVVISLTMAENELNQGQIGSILESMVSASDKLPGTVGKVLVSEVTSAGDSTSTDVERRIWYYEVDTSSTWVYQNWSDPLP